jgi:16S rRNA (adenine1518-N6/adenine1519-N6)-dimethyltransferase
MSDGTIAMLTQTEIRELMDGHGLAPRRHLGQNFLVDGNLMRLLIETADPQKTDICLEVGCGPGNLTELLLPKVAHVVGVEIDDGLFALLNERLGEKRKATFINEDVLERKSVIRSEVLNALRIQCAKDPEANCILISNLPYDVACPVVIDLLLGPLRFTKMTFTVQKEVSDRLAAKPSTPEYGPMSVLVQAMATVKAVRKIPASAFWPEPRVESAIVQVTDSPTRRKKIKDQLNFLALTEALFGHRRKTISASLRLSRHPRLNQLHWPDILAKMDISPRARGESLSVDQIVALAAQVPVPR